MSCARRFFKVVLPCPSVVPVGIEHYHSSINSMWVKCGLVACAGDATLPGGEGTVFFLCVVRYQHIAAMLKAFRA